MERGGTYPPLPERPLSSSRVFGPKITHFLAEISLAELEGTPSLSGKNPLTSQYFFLLSFALFLFFVLNAGSSGHEALRQQADEVVVHC